MQHSPREKQQKKEITYIIRKVVNRRIQILKAKNQNKYRNLSHFLEPADLEAAVIKNRIGVILRTLNGGSHKGSI